MRKKRFVVLGAIAVFALAVWLILDMQADKKAIIEFEIRRLEKLQGRVKIIQEDPEDFKANLRKLLNINEEARLRLPDYGPGWWDERKKIDDRGRIYVIPAYPGAWRDLDEIEMEINSLGGEMQISSMSSLDLLFYFETSAIASISLPQDVVAKFVLYCRNMSRLVRWNSITINAQSESGVVSFDLHFTLYRSLMNVGVTKGLNCSRRNDKDKEMIDVLFPSLADLRAKRNRLCLELEEQYHIVAPIMAERKIREGLERRITIIRHLKEKTGNLEVLEQLLEYESEKK